MTRFFTLLCLLNFSGAMSQSISPGILWSTYYSSNSNTLSLSYSHDVVIDSRSNVYMLGSTYDDDLDYRGAEMTKQAGEQAFLVKFNKKGQRIWATYLDDFMPDYHGMAMTIDADDYLYVTGSRISGLKTIGVVVKLDSEGHEVWSKTIVGSRVHPTGITTDINGNILLAGIVNSTTGIAVNGHDMVFGSTGGYSTAPDGFLIKIDPTGQTLWGTYCGGEGVDEAHGVVTDNVGNAYIIGTTSSTTGIAFNGFDNTFGAPDSDGFIIKYSENGMMVWGTYYGGSHEDSGMALAFDKVNNVLYAGGRTLASPDLAYNGYDNEVNYYDAWLAKFTIDGQRIWATYYGGPGTVVGFDIIYDDCEKLAVDNVGNVYMAGLTRNSIDIAFNGFDNTYNGGFDTYITKFNSNGSLLWGTYFGEVGDDGVSGLVVDGDALYMTGTVTGSPGLSYRGFDNTFAPGNMDAYLVKVTDTPDEKRSFITGFVYEDKNKNCIKDSGERPIAGVLIRTDPVAYFASSDSSGFYEIAVDPGFYNVQQVVTTDNKNIVSQICPSGLVHNVSLINKGDSISNINFGNEVTPCFNIEVNVSSSQRRRCSLNETVISYKNTGYADATNVKIFVELPEFVTLKSSQTSFIKESGGLYSFNISVVKSGETGRLILVDSVICGNSAIRGITQCTKAWVTPSNNCFPLKPTWDRSNVTLTARCLGPDNVKLVIRNNGVGDMADSSQFRLFFDSKLTLEGKFKLRMSDSLVMRLAPHGKAIYFQADQRPDHPTEQGTSLIMEGCGALQDIISIGFSNTFPLDSNDPSSDIECLPIIDSFDPNDKMVSPVGLEAEHYVSDSVRLEYTIRFQNTGNAPAIEVIILDSLDHNLDIKTIRIEGSSHRADFSIQGIDQPVLLWSFENIYLPDSTHNEPASHGFVKFSILPYSGLPDKTVINNAAFIQFDFNEPLKTNQVKTTLHNYPWQHDDNHLIASEIIILKPVINAMTLDKQDSKMLVISGLNFSSILTENIVLFNGKQLTVITATTTELTIANDEAFSNNGDVQVINLAGSDNAQLIILANEENPNSNVPSKLYPNPVTRLLNIPLSRFDQDRPVSIRILSNTGVILQQFEVVGKSELILDVHQLPVGIYCLELTQGHKRETQKMVKVND